MIEELLRDAESHWRSATVKTQAEIEEIKKEIARLKEQLARCRTDKIEAKANGWDDLFDKIAHCQILSEERLHKLELVLEFTEFYLDLEIAMAFNQSRPQYKVSLLALDMKSGKIPAQIPSHN